MASEKLTQLTLEAPAATALLYFVKDPSGTPLSRATALSNIISLSQHQIGFGSATGMVTGDAGFTFEDGSLVVGQAIYSPGEVSLTLNDTVALAMDAAFIQLVTVVDKASSSTNSYIQGQDTFAQLVGDFNYVIGANFRAAGFPNASGIAVIGVATQATGFAGVIDAIGLKVNDVAGATNNRAIQTGAGDIVFGTLAGTGSRPVLADANGKLTAL